jgi:hypothetical protein
MNPGDVCLADNDAVIGPIAEVVGREHVVVFHAEPSDAAASFSGENIMRRIEIHSPFKYPCGRIRSELIRDNRVLGK